MSTLTSQFICISLPIASEKLEGQARVLTFLDIDIDALNLQLQLPHTKLRELQVLVKSWLGWKFCSRRELQSLTGMLQYAYMEVKPAADAISQGNRGVFFEVAPEACWSPTVLDLLVEHQPDCLSRAWAPVVQEQFSAGLAVSAQRTYLMGERRYVVFARLTSCERFQPWSQS